ncbi:MAG TPA: SDR family NAD(P)-dependent oxidoreductase, partial [Pseudomonadales bacterium]
HNASVLGDLTLVENYSPDTWATVMQVNLTAPFLLTQALLPLMKKSADASIVFTSSSVGRKGRAYWGAYGISKFGIEGLMQTLASELENTSSIRANSLNPGATRTGMRASAYPAENPETLLAPEDILNIYLFLMGEDSKGITAQALDAQLPKAT